jgi:acetyltransferase EpsM
VKKKIIIFGAGGHAGVVTSEIKKINKYEVEGYFVKNIQDKNINKNLRKKVLEFDLNKINKVLKKNFSLFVAIGDNLLRKKIVEEINNYKPNVIWENIISIDSTVDPTVKFGFGNLIMPGCIINAFTEIKNHCLINTGAVIEHENFLNNYSSVGPRAVTAGKVNIGQLSHIGMGSSVLEDIKIGKNVIIGANSLVSKNIQTEGTYYGSPAKFVRNNCDR